MRKTAFLVVVTLALAFTIYAGARHFARRSKPSIATSSLPNLVLTDLDGKTIRTSDYKGKVVLVNFWAAWCTPCAEEIPEFKALEEKYGAQGLQVLGISIDDIDAELRAFYRKHNINYPVIAGDQKATDAFGGVPGLPTTFIIGRDARIHARQVGATNFPALEQQVLALLHQ
jgi:peroxiredoxin